MAKINLNDIQSIYDLTQLNQDFADIESEFQNKVLYRDNPTGEPNQMENALDMNSNRILNLPKPVSNSEAARLADVQAGISGNQANLIEYNDSNVQEALDKRTIYVGSVAELEALSLAEGANVYLTEDGRAGEFVVKTGTPPSDPQKGIYVVLANGNYAERIKKSPAKFSWFGAVSNQDSDTEVAAALSMNLGIYEDFGGPYIMSSTITPEASTVIMGAGTHKDLFKVKAGVTVDNLIYIADTKDDVTLENFSIDGNKVNTTAPASNYDGNMIFFYSDNGNTFKATVRNVRVHDNHKSAIIATLNQGTVNRTLLTETEVLIDGLQAENCRNTQIVGANGLTVRNCKLNGNGTGINIDDSINVETHNNEASNNNSNGILFNYVSDVRVFENTCNDNGGTGGIVFGGGVAIKAPNIDYTVHDNVCNRNAIGISNDPTVSGDLDTLVSIKATVRNNTCKDNGTHGVYFQTCKDFSASGNWCEGSGNSGIAIKGSHFSVVNNDLVGNLTYGISLQGSGASPTSPIPSDINVYSNRYDNPAAVNDFEILPSGLYTDVSGAIRYVPSVNFFGTITAGSSATHVYSVKGATVGHEARVTFGVGLKGLDMLAWVSNADEITVTLTNNTGASIIHGATTAKLQTLRIG